MKPYYDDQNGTRIYHADCRDVLPELGKVDLVLTDPPYAIGAGRGEWAATAGVAIGLHYAAKAVTKEGAMLCFSTSSGRGIEYTLGAVGKVLPFNRMLVWRKPLGTSKAAGPWKWDLVSILAFGRSTFGTAFSSSLIESAEPRIGREHPSQVPVDVASWLFLPFNDKPVTVLDPFMGSGRLLVPAVSRGQSAIGIDVEERWCELAARNLERALLSPWDHVAALPLPSGGGQP